MKSQAPILSQSRLKVKAVLLQVSLYRILNYSLPLMSIWCKDLRFQLNFFFYRMLNIIGKTAKKLMAVML